MNKTLVNKLTLRATIKEKLDQAHQELGQIEMDHYDFMHANGLMPPRAIDVELYERRINRRVIELEQTVHVLSAILKEAGVPYYENDKA